MLPGSRFSPKEVLPDAGPKNCSLRRDSGTGLTMNLRPAEWTTWEAVLGEIPEGEDGRSDMLYYVLYVFPYMYLFLPPTYLTFAPNT